MGNYLLDIYNGQPGTSNTTLYTCPTNTKVRVLAATVVNDTTTAAFITVHRVPSGGSVSDANMIINEATIGSQEAKPLSALIGQVLEAGDYISALAEVASQLTVHISGVAIT